MKKAFTLAEVLITLTILGVIAIIVFPNLMSNYKKRYTITRLKQAYSLFYNATREAEIIYGIDSDNWSYSNNNDVYNYFIPMLKISTDCRKGGRCIGVNGKEIFGNSDPGYTYFKRPDNTYVKVGSSWGNNSAILSNGMSIVFSPNNSYQYIQMDIDIDGPKKGPNMFGYDIFTLFFTKAKSDTIDKNPRFHRYTTTWNVKHVDLNNAKSRCSKTDTDGCFAYIMLSGWKIPNVYPVKF